MRNALVLLSLLATCTANAALAPRPSSRHEAGGNKTGNYISEGFFAGGERNVTAVKLKDIRRAKSSEGFERIVLDLETAADDKNGVPYFQVQAAPDEGRLIVSIWGDVAYDFDGNRVRKAFAKSANVKRLNVLPRVEEGLAVIELTLGTSKGKKHKFEAFRLSHPARIIVDIL